MEALAYDLSLEKCRRLTCAERGQRCGRDKKIEYAK